MKYSFTVEITGKVEIGSITDADVIRVLSRYSNRMEMIDDDRSFQRADKNRELLSAALDNSDAMIRIVNGIALFEASQVLEDLHREYEDNNSDSDIVNQLAPQLSRDTALYFKQADQSGVLAENIEHFRDAFKFSIGKSTVTIQKS